jgi:hypothetical protein
MKSIAAIVRNAAFAAIVCTTIATLLSITFKDRWPVLSVLYYATPWLLRLLAAFIALAFFPKRKSVRAMAAVCIFTAGLQGWESYRHDEKPAPDEINKALRVSFWNGARSFSREPEYWPVHGNADLIAMVETGPFRFRDWKPFQATRPDCQWRRLDEGMLIGVRGKILSAEELGVKDRFRCHRLLVSVPGQGEFHVVVIDMRSSAWLNREPSLKKILAAARGDPRCIVLGDFNTPAQSYWLDEWRQNGLSLANDGARQGFRETWAYGLPLMTLDQIWTGGDWRSIAAGVSRPAHDHSRVEVLLAPK